ncbi:GNAT family N-acetyltransferase [uncultured Limosilactobacillus sp.]|uniref:GNAT family N-acetyltransferase n=1 Tax=uncultured Limosilactobacillus sp. TaxID=2837629 RepID=UPI00129DDEA7|nr:GNAT family N-acetyltransferase [uncultured Limosilactobacillus sp.]
MIQWYDKQFDELTVNELLAILKLRAIVFNQEQHSSYPDPDDQDRHAHHVFAIKDRQIIAYARYFIQDNYATFGRVVVTPRFRKTGLGRLIVDHLLHGIVHNYANREIIIHAQAYVEKFYQQYGFMAVGDHFTEAGREHVTMIYQPRTKKEVTDYD